MSVKAVLFKYTATVGIMQYKILSTFNESGINYIIAECQDCKHTPLCKVLIKQAEHLNSGVYHFVRMWNDDEVDYEYKCFNHTILDHEMYYSNYEDCINFLYDYLESECQKRINAVTATLKKRENELEKIKCERRNRLKYRSK